MIRRTSKRYIIGNSLANNLDLQVRLLSKMVDRCWLRPIEFWQNAEFTYEVYYCDENSISLAELIDTELTDD